MTLLLISLPMMVCAFWLVFYLLEWNQSAPQTTHIASAKHVMFFFYAATVILYTCHFLYFSGHKNPVGEITYAIVNLCVYPLFYLYLITLTTHNNSKNLIDLKLLFAPAFIIFVSYIICFIGDYAVVRNGFYLFARICFAVQVIYVWIYGSRLLKDHIAQLDNYYSDNRSYSFQPLKTLIHLFGIIAIASAILNFIGREWFAGNTMIAIPALLMCILLYALGYVAKDIEPLSLENNESHDTDDANSSDAIHSDYPNDALCQQLEQLMEHEKPYLNPKLTIYDIAIMLGTNRTYISNLINKHYKMNFAQFINTYRVEHAKKILVSIEYSTDKEAIQDSIVLSGFPSENNFYRTFKQLTGMTPLNWRKQQLTNSHQA